MTVSVMFPADVSTDDTAEKAEPFFLRQQKAVQARAGLLPMYDALRSIFDISDPFYNLAGVDKVVYRGASLTSKQYADLYAQLAEAGVNMVISPHMYDKTHYASEWYPAFKSLMSDAVFLPHIELKSYSNTLSRYLFEHIDFLNYYDNFVIRDTGATEKDRALVILRQDVFEHIAEIISLQNGNTEGNVEIIGVNSSSTTIRLKVWWVDAKAVVVTDNFDSAITIPDDFMKQVQSAVQSLGCPFVTTVVAMKEDGSWEVVAVEDGQVSYFSGYPDEDAFGDIFCALQSLG